MSITVQIARDTMKNVKLSSLFALLLASATGCAGAQPQAPRQQGAVLHDCPDSPKCVSSQSEDPDHHIAPLEFTGTPETAFARLRRILAARSDTQIAIATPAYLKVEFKTLLGFIDDGEFYLDAEKNVIECRSESRSGKG
jgi:uncharacterized protein (DUF1499 family)